MNIRAPIIIAVGACVFTAGCATVNIGAVTGEAARRAENQAAAPAQADLRQASVEFERYAREADLAEEAGFGAAAQRAINVLLHGRSDEDPEAAVADPVEAFLEARGLRDIAPEVAAVSLAEDIRQVRTRVRTVATAAQEVAAGPPREAWERREDLGAAESVVRLARRADMILRGASEQIASDVSREERRLLEGELASLTVELDNLSAAADALSAAPEQNDIAPVAVSFVAHPDFG